jgi:acyl dehydratase
MSGGLPVVGRGFCFEDLELGARFRTHRRTISEADLSNFVNLPGALVYSFAVGLLLPTMQDTGLAFLNATLDVKRSTVVGDTIHVECEVIEHRLTSKGDRGLVRFSNKVVNQRGETVLEYNPLRMLRRREE